MKVRDEIRALGQPEAARGRRAITADELQRYIDRGQRLRAEFIARLLRRGVSARCGSFAGPPGHCCAGDSSGASAAAGLWRAHGLRWRSSTGSWRRRLEEERQEPA